VWPDLWGETSGVFTSPDVFARIAGSVPGMRDGSAEEELPPNWPVGVNIGPAAR
jgi:hypothetical protein